MESPLIAAGAGAEPRRPANSGAVAPEQSRRWLSWASGTRIEEGASWVSREEAVSLVVGQTALVTHLVSQQAWGRQVFPGLSTWGGGHTRVGNEGQGVPGCNHLPRRVHLGWVWG